MRERFSNDVFFAATRGPPRAFAIPEDAFYAGRTRPPVEPHLVERAAATPMRFALLILAVGWGGILFQTGFFQQVVFGAPVFEELAKLGPALIVLGLLRTRTLWIGLPLAWASGAGFGVMEHFLTYAAEDDITYYGRIAFHAGSTGLSMLFYAAFEGFGDVRARWASTIPSTLFHWANNFMALLLGLGSLLVPAADRIAAGWAAGITLCVWLATATALLVPSRFRAFSHETLERAMPRLGLVRARSQALAQQP